MSVGVCIINRNGIALAADSAGTYTGNKMFYNSMNKVFSISRKYVYGVITYGATVIHNVSIDQVLKEFRTFLDSKSEVNDFFEILPSFVEFIEQKNKEAFLSVKNEIASAIDTTIQNSNVMPILNSVQLIPLAEMAFFAENLVNMTTLKRTFAIDGNQQTVGGPTDVTVLSKGDGFVWIQRKLYFDGQLNPNYALRLCEF